MLIVERRSIFYDLHEFFQKFMYSRISPYTFLIDSFSMWSSFVYILSKIALYIVYLMLLDKYLRHNEITLPQIERCDIFLPLLILHNYFSNFRSLWTLYLNNISPYLVNIWTKKLLALEFNVGWISCLWAIDTDFTTKFYPGHS